MEFAHYDFEYDGHKWGRDGCKFYILVKAPQTTTRVIVKPHRYFEAFAAMKNKEGRKNG